MTFFPATLSKTTTDQIKSKILTPELSQLVFDVYMTPEQYADMVKKCFDREINLSISTYEEGNRHEKN